jgi:hypothetical protein
VQAKTPVWSRNSPGIVAPATLAPTHNLSRPEQSPQIGGNPVTEYQKDDTNRCHMGDRPVEPAVSARSACKPSNVVNIMDPLKKSVQEELKSRKAS